MGKPRGLALMILFLVFLWHQPLLAATRNVSLNFENIDIRNFIEIMSKISKKTYVFDEKSIRGKVTLISQQKFTKIEALRIFESILDMNDLTTIDEGLAIRVLNKREARYETSRIESKSPVKITKEFITRLIRVRNVNVQTIRSILAPLVSKSGILNFYAPGNILIITDTEQNTERVAKIVKVLDKQDLKDPLILEIYRAKHAGVKELTALINQVLSLKNGTPAKGASPDGDTTILIDERTNGLILISRKENEIKFIKELIDKFDVETEEGGGQKGNLRVFQLKYSQAQKVATILQSLVSGPTTARGRSPAAKVHVIADPATNSIVVTADSIQMTEIEEAIWKLDIVRPQVYLEALIMEATFSKSLNIGVQWRSSAERDGRVGSVASGQSAVPQGVEETLATGSGSVVGVVGSTFTYGGVEYPSFSSFIKATQEDKEIELLASPKILTLNNEEAEIKVVQVMPTIKDKVRATTGEETFTYDYKEVGVSLKITPQINQGDTILMKVNQTSAELIPGGSVTVGAITTLNRSITTNVLVNNAQTVVLGGLISEKNTEVESKTPCLGDIPGIGWLFKYKNTETSKVNLLVFLKPQIIRTQEDLENLTQSSSHQFKRSKNGKFKIDITKELNLPALNPKKLEEEELSEEEVNEAAEDETEDQKEWKEYQGKADKVESKPVEEQKEPAEKKPVGVTEPSDSSAQSDKEVAE